MKISAMCELSIPGCQSWLARK